MKEEPKSMANKNSKLKKIVDNVKKTGKGVQEDFTRGLKDVGSVVQGARKGVYEAGNKLQKAIRKVLPKKKGVDQQLIDMRVSPKTGKPWVPPVPMPDPSKERSEKQYNRAEGGASYVIPKNPNDKRPKIRVN